MRKSFKLPFLLVVAVLIMGNSNSLLSLDKIISNFEWEKRILLLIADHEDINLIRGVDNFFKKEACENKNRNLGVEKDKKYGIQNFSCIKDEFGLITISGQFNNNQIKKDKIVLEILFLDYEKNVIFKNTANLLEIDEFETKRFLGNTKIDKPFLTCTIKVNG